MTQLRNCWLSPVVDVVLHKHPGLWFAEALMRLRDCRLHELPRKHAQSRALTPAPVDNGQVRIAACWAWWCMPVNPSSGEAELYQSAWAPTKTVLESLTKHVSVHALFVYVCVYVLVSVGVCMCVYRLYACVWAQMWRPKADISCLSSIYVFWDGLESLISRVYLAMLELQAYAYTHTPRVFCLF